MYRSAAIIVVCLAFVTIIGSFTQNDTSRFQKEIESVREEMRTLRALSHDFNSLEQEVAQLQKKLASVSITQDSAVSKTSYRISKDFRDDPYLGDAQAPVLFMMFGDYECQACQAFWKNTLPKLKEQFIEPKKAFFSFRDFTLSSHQHAKQAGNYAHCTGEQGGYWKAFDAMYQNMDLVTSGNFDSLTTKLSDINTTKLQRCIASNRYDDEMLKDRQEGQAIGAKGIPGFFIGKRKKGDQFEGVFVRGAQPTEIIIKEIEKLL